MIGAGAMQHTHRYQGWHLAQHSTAIQMPWRLCMRIAFVICAHGDLRLWSMHEERPPTDRRERRDSLVRGWGSSLSWSAPSRATIFTKAHRGGRRAASNGTRPHRATHISHTHGCMHADIHAWVHAHKRSKCVAQLFVMLCALSTARPEHAPGWCTEVASLGGSGAGWRSLRDPPPPPPLARNGAQTHVAACAPYQRISRASAPLEKFHQPSEACFQQKTSR